MRNWTNVYSGGRAKDLDFIQYFIENLSNEEKKRQVSSRIAITNN